MPELGSLSVATYALSAAGLADSFRTNPATDSDTAGKVAAFSSESVAAFRRNGWPPSIGIGGRIGAENAHTPDSHLNNQFGTDWDIYVQELFRRAVRNGIAVIGVTDYFSVKGYRRLTEEFLNDEERMSTLFKNDVVADPMFLQRVAAIRLLPNVELRVERLAGKKDEEKRLTIHVLFSDEVSGRVIEEDFLHRLRLPIMGGTQRLDDRPSLTETNLRRLGDRLCAEEPSFSGKDPLFVGMMNAMVNDEEIMEVLEGQSSLFQNRYLIAMAEEATSWLDWKGQGHQARKVLIQKSDLLFSANPNTIAWASNLEDGGEFGGPKPCIWGSDAHKVDELFQSGHERFLWLKAEPTFRGLKHVIADHRDRIFIGSKPLLVSELDEHRRLFIEKVTLRKNNDSSLTERWFDGIDLEFNPEMVAIIGNKGSGKSAMADVLSLLGHTKMEPQRFSFLTEKRFKSKDAKGGRDRSTEFEATLTWSDGRSEKRPLSSTVAPGDLEEVRYLPQGYLEHICNDRDSADAFQAELDRVLFSHVDSAARLDQGSLSELIDFRTSEIKTRVSGLKARVREVNVAIVATEARLSPAAIEQVEAKIQAKIAELEAVKKDESAVPAPPIIDESTALANAGVAHDFEVVEVQQKSVAAQVREREQQVADLTLRLARLAKLRESIATLAQESASTVERLRPDADDLGLQMESLVQIVVNLESLDTASLKSRSDLEVARGALTDVGEGSLSFQASQLRERAGALRDKLDGPQKQFQAEIERRKQWEVRRDEIVGAATIPGSLLALQADRDAVATELPNTLADLRRQRELLTRRIYDERRAEVGVFEEYYRPVQKFVSEANFIGGSFGLRFDVALAASGFVGEFLQFIQQGMAGSFYGTEDGRRRVEELARPSHFQESDEMLRFIEEILGALQIDLRNSERRPMDIDRQLAKNVDRKKLYDYLFSLDYIAPRYGLTLEGKMLPALSPGERGLLLLVFYLIVDRERIPLLIDQPEENLDNQSIKRLLVPCIRDAKRRRQIFLVTHNANLAVVCDAEQVILARLEKEDQYTATYRSGAIEDPEMNLTVVDILEGTKPAFENRRRKYRSAGTI